MQIRPFDGTIRDALGIIEVDRATFGDCHYTPEYILALEQDPQQRAWVAYEGGQAVGFVSAFPTHSLAASRWEIDELAVSPTYQGRGIGTALVGQALAEGMARSDLSQARALVATDNLSSQRVFAKNGHAPSGTVHLLLYEVTGRVPRPRQAGTPEVRVAQGADAPLVAALAGCAEDRASRLLQLSDHVTLIAERAGQARGYAELLQVRTLQYQGFWIESLVVVDRRERAAAARFASAIFASAIEEAKRRDAIDEIGYLASPTERALYTACVGEGFGKVNEYLPFLRTLHT